MPKKQSKHDPKNFWPSGLPKDQPTNPTARMKKGLSAAIDWEEISSPPMLKRRKGLPPPKKWKNLTDIIPNSFLDEVLISMGFGVIQEMTLDNADEMFGILNALVPGKRTVGVGGVERKINPVSPLDSKKSKEAIRELMDTFKYQYPGSDLAGRGIGILAQVAGVPGMIKLLTPIMVRFGLKPTVFIIGRLQKIMEKSPKMVKLLKTRPVEGLNQVKNALMTSKVAKTTLDVGAEGTVQAFGESEKPMVGAAKEAVTNPWNLAFTAAPGALKATGEAVKIGAKGLNAGVRKINQLYSDLAPKVARGMAKVAGFSDKSIAFLEKNKYLFPGGDVASREETLDLIQDFLETAYKSQFDLNNSATSVLLRNRPNINRAEVEESVNEAILSLFTKKGYTPSEGLDPFANNPTRNMFAFDDLEYREIKNKLSGAEGLLKRHEDAINYAQSRRALAVQGVKIKKKLTPKASSSLLSPSKKKWPGEPSDIKLIDGEMEFIKPKGAGNDPSYWSKDQLLKESGLSRFKGNKALQELLDLRESLRHYNGYMSETQLKMILDDVTSKADYNDKAGVFTKAGELSQFQGAHRVLRNNLRKTLGTANKEWDKKTKEVANFLKALNDGPEGQTFRDLFGVERRESYIKGVDGEEYPTYTFSIPDKDKTHKALIEATSADKQKDNPYRDSLKRVLNAGMEVADINRVAAKKERRPPMFRKDGPSKKYTDDIHTTQKKDSAQSSRIKSQNLYEKVKRDVLTDAFEDPERANDLMLRLEREYFNDTRKLKGEGVSHIAGAKSDFGKLYRGVQGVFRGAAAVAGRPLGYSGNVGGFTTAGNQLFALFMSKFIAKEIKTGKDYLTLLDSAKKWKIGYEANPEKFLQKLDISQDFVKKWGGAKTERLIKNELSKHGELSTEKILEQDQKTETPSELPESSFPKIDLDQGSVPIETLPPSYDPARGNLEPKIASSEPLEIPFVDDSGTYEDFEDFENEENFLSPEEDEREKRKDKINAFLEKQGAFRRKKRGGYA
jgi:hypothetical protein